MQMLYKSPIAKRRADDLFGALSVLDETVCYVDHILNKMEIVIAMYFIITSDNVTFLH